MNNNAAAQATWDSLAAQTIGIHKGSKPISFKKNLPNAFIPPSNVPGMACVNKIIALVAC